jgi:uncharacterized protein
MARLLFLIALACLVLWLWRRIRHRPWRRRPSPPPPQVQPMVRCTHCGLHVPREEALGSAPHWYCCRAHLDADQADQKDD